jgi:putative endonuclease
MGPDEERRAGSLVTRAPHGPAAHFRRNAEHEPRDTAPAAAHARAVKGSPLNGRSAEDLAAAYLGVHGLELLDRNVRCKAGEIDLVCREGATLILIEVRQRARSDFGGALASVAGSKRRKILRAARFVLHTRAEWRGCLVRFDVVGVHGSPQGTHEIEWVKDAFRA